MTETVVIPVSEPLCDFCNDTLTDNEDRVVKSFVLTDGGTLCVECWDGKIKQYEEWKVSAVYAKSQTVQDEWVDRPMILEFPDEPERGNWKVMEMKYENSENAGQLATDKQKNYIKFLVDSRAITRQQASSVIDILKDQGTE